jgi:hypothetical protein
LGEIECVQPTLFCFIYGGGYLSAVMPIPWLSRIWREGKNGDYIKFAFAHLESCWGAGKVES